MVYPIRVFLTVSANYVLTKHLRIGSKFSSRRTFFPASTVSIFFSNSIFTPFSSYFCAPLFSVVLSSFFDFHYRISEKMRSSKSPVRRLSVSSSFDSGAVAVF